MYFRISVVTRSFPLANCHFSASRPALNLVQEAQRTEHRMYFGISVVTRSFPLTNRHFSASRPALNLLQEAQRTEHRTQLDDMLVHHRVTTSIIFAGTHFIDLGGSGTARVKCAGQRLFSIFPVRALS